MNGGVWYVVIRGLRSFTVNQVGIVLELPVSGELKVKGLQRTSNANSGRLKIQRVVAG